MKRKYRAALLFVLSAAMLIYAVPQLDIGHGWTEETIFAAFWIVISLLIVAAHLHEWIGVDEQTQKDLKAVKRYKYWRMQQKMTARLEGKRDHS